MGDRLVCEGNHLTKEKRASGYFLLLLERFHVLFRTVPSFAGVVLAVAALSACGGGGGSSSSPAPTATPTVAPTPSAVTISSSPSPFSISVSGSNHSGTVTAEQTGATGYLVATSTSTPACFSATPAPSDLTTQETPTGSFSNGTAQIGFMLVAKAAGTCTVTITPVSGTPATLTVTVTP
jgi:hypothetical protein